MSPAKKNAMQVAATRVADTVEAGLDRLGPVITDLKRHIEELMSGLSRHPHAQPKAKKRKPAKRRAKPAMTAKTKAKGGTSRRATRAK